MCWACVPQTRKKSTNDSKSCTPRCLHTTRRPCMCSRALKSIGALIKPEEVEESYQGQWVIFLRCCCIFICCVLLWLFIIFSQHWIAAHLSVAHDVRGTGRGSLDVFSGRTVPPFVFFDFLTCRYIYFGKFFLSVRCPARL